MTLAKTSEENLEDRPHGNDLWGSLLNGTDGSADKGTSACDAWQAFLNGPHCKDHSGVPESEWLQTAASVSPSNDKEPRIRSATSSQGFLKFQVGTDTPTTLHPHAVCQPLSDTREAALANVALNAEGHQSAEGCGSSAGDDNTVTREAPQRSQTNSVTDTLQEFSIKGATPVSEGYVDSSTKCHKRAIWERGRKGIIEEAGIGGDEPFTPHIADLVTSSGESKTTDMTAMPESQNARTVDRISQGARLDGGLCSSAGGEVTGTAHNAMHDTLAFRETIRQGIKDGARVLFSASRLGEERRILTNCKDNKVCTEEKLFGRLKTDEKQGEETRPNQKSENPSQENEGEEHEIKPEQLHTSELKQITCEENFRQSQIMKKEFKPEESYEDLKELRQTEIQTPHCFTSKYTKGLIDAESDIIQVLPEETRHENNKVITLNLSEGQRGGTSEEEVDDKQLKGECVQRKEEGSSPTQMEVDPALKSKTDKRVKMSDQTEEGKSLSCGDATQSQHEINTDRAEHGPAGKYPPKAELRWTHSQEVMTGQREEISPEHVMSEENSVKEDTSTELQHQPETLGRNEVNMSHVGGGLMGNVGDPRAERRTAESNAALEVIGSGVEKMLLERFAEDLVRGICEEVFGRKVQDCNRDTNIVAGREPAMMTDSNESPEERRTSTDQTHFHSEIQRDLNVSDRSGDLTTTLPTQSRKSLTDSSQTLSSAEEDCFQIKQRSVPHQETGGQTEECVVTQKESLNRLAPPSQKHMSCSSEKSKQSSGLIWWSVLYILSHITRLLICGLLVAGFFVILFLYDFPAFFVLYICSLSWWFYKWKRCRVLTNKEMMG